MADIDVPHIPFRAFLDPLLDYISSILPDSAYDLFLTLLSYCLTLFTGIFSLAYTLATSHPSQWDSQTILPPLITLLAAYLSLISLYRTTSWMIRSSVFFVKWGVIVGAILAGSGWIMGSNTGKANGGFTSAIGGVVLDMINGPGQNAAGGPRRETRSSSRSRTRQYAPRPKPWESFDRHREWQYQEEDMNDDEVEGGEMQKIVRDMVGAAGRAVLEGVLWDALKGAMEGESENAEDGEDGDDDVLPPRRQPSRKAKTKARTAGPR